MEHNSEERYILWINKNLICAKKNYQISSLQDKNIRNGKTLIDIFEYLSQTKVVGIVTSISKRSILFNIQAVLNHVVNLNIRMSLLRATDIERGDSHSIMRFFLGLICHFQPHLVRSKKRNSFIQGGRTSPSISHNYKSKKVSPSVKSPIHMRLKKIMNVHRAVSDQSDLDVPESRNRQIMDLHNTEWISQDIPKDIREVHDQLSTLMRLLSQTDSEGPMLNTRNVSCQTIGTESDNEQLMWQRDQEFQDKLNGLVLELEAKNRSIEKHIREITVLKAQLSRQRLDNKNTNQLLLFLNDIKPRMVLDSNDFDKLNELIGNLGHISKIAISQIEKANVAVVSPCSNIKDTGPLTHLPLHTVSTPIITFNSQTEEVKSYSETKLVCFLDHSVTPYMSTIPLPSSQITLSHVKHYTRSVLPKNTVYRFIFRSNNEDVGQTQEEISLDSDFVPVQDNKIVVRIRT